jgi:AhpD family alkylhydroperoxidase
MANEFSRKIYTAKSLVKDAMYLLGKSPEIKAAFHDQDISRAFMEKIFIVVTAVNGCVYCTWFHVKQAISSGISSEELKNILDLQFQAEADDFEVTALLYAQHYAETDRQPDTEMIHRLLDFYGEKTAEHINLIIRVIYFGNLLGNTFDAFISRLKGHKAPNSNVFFEAIFFILSAPVLLPLIPDNELHPLSPPSCAPLSIKVCLTPFWEWLSPGGFPGLQNRWRVALRAAVGSTPIHSRLRFADNLMSITIRSITMVS